MSAFLKLIFLFLFLTHTAYAVKPPCETLSVLKSIAAPSRDAAIEFEVETNLKLLNLIDSSDGKLGSLLLPGEHFPSFINRLAERKNVAPKDLVFDELFPLHKKNLLDKLLEQRNVDFFENRNIHGLVMKKSLEVELKRPLRLFGKDYPPGKQQLDLSALNPTIEYRSAHDTKKFTGIEFTARAPLPAGELWESAIKLEELLEIERTHFHVHLVGRVPIETLKKEPMLGALTLTEHSRRSNLAAEVYEIILEKKDIHKRFDDVEKIDYFGPADPNYFTNTFLHFNTLGVKGSSKLGKGAKIGWVGTYGIDKYDEPLTWGLELRALRSDTDVNEYSKFISLTQHSMNTGEYFATLDEARAWAKHLNTKNLGRFSIKRILPLQSSPLETLKSIQNAWYRPLTPRTINEIPKPLREAYQKAEKTFLNKIQPIKLDPDLNIYRAPNLDLHMLTYDWANDPLFYNKPHLLNLITQQQIHSLNQIALGSPTRDVMRNFLIESKIAETVFEAIGLKI